MFWKPKNQFCTAYQIIPEEKLLIEVYSGVMTLDRLKSFKLDEVYNPNFNPDYDRILLSVNLRIDMHFGEVDEYVEFLLSNEIKLSGNRKSILVVNTPHSEVYHTYLKSVSGALPERIYVVKTLECALEILERPYLQLKLEKLIKTMYKNPMHKW